MTDRELKSCGTVAAYRRHTRHGEQPCDACRAVEKAAKLARYLKTYPNWQPRPDEPQPCGTVAAYGRHKKAGQAACQPCLDAWAAYVRGRRQARKAAA